MVEFSGAVAPPAGLSGREVLWGLACEFGAEIDADVTGKIKGIVEAGLGALVSFYWNTGQEMVSTGKTRIVAPETGPETVSIQPPLTHAEKYKREIREVGTERFRVRS